MPGDDGYLKEAPLKLSLAEAKAYSEKVTAGLAAFLSSYVGTKQELSKEIKVEIRSFVQGETYGHINIYISQKKSPSTFSSSISIPFIVKED